MRAKKASTKSLKWKVSFFLSVLLITIVNTNAGTRDSGGPILPEQAAYDVLYYGINLKIDPSLQKISGYTIVEAAFMEAETEFVLHLHDRFTISEVKLIAENSSSSLSFTHSNGLIRINKSISQYELIKVEIHYSGLQPHTNGLPWNTGFAYTKSNGLPWVGMACEDEGADLWIPCKDHPSDEPDSVAINLTVPSNLVCVANGQDRGTTDVDANWKTFHWFVSNPINNYNITFYIADYEKLTFDYTSISGEPMPLEFWVLPDSKTDLQNHGVNLLKYIKAMEELCGPFPFRADKFAYVHSNYWGMEHQSAIAYGHDFSVDQYGLDYIAVHELAHEWWGNLVTAKNWRDCWIHEGFGTYMEALVAEKLNSNNYHNYVSKFFTTKSSKPVAPDEDVTATQIFSGQHGIYYKGATILHNLRFLLGDEKLFQFIRKCAYPDPIMETYTDGRQCRLATTEEIIEIANQVAGKDISWYFDVILKTTNPPVLNITKNEKTLNFEWVTSKNQKYDMPVEIEVNGTIHKVEFVNNKAEFILTSEYETPIFDPNKWLMKEENYIVGINDIDDQEEIKLNLNTYPNPFNSTAQIEISLASDEMVSLKIFDITGKLVKELLHENLSKGVYKLNWEANNLPSGTYFLRYSDGKNHLSKKLILLK